MYTMVISEGANVLILSGTSHPVTRRAVVRHPSFPRPSKTCPRLQLPGDLPWQQIKRVVALRGGTGGSLTCVLQCYRNELAATQLYTSHTHDDVTALIRSANVDKRPTACPRADIQFHPRLGR